MDAHHIMDSNRARIKIVNQRYYRYTSYINRLLIVMCFVNQQKNQNGRSFDVEILSFFPLDVNAGSFCRGQLQQCVSGSK